MKRTATILSVILLVAMLTACGSSKSSYIGKWNVTSAEMGGSSVDVATMLGGDFSFELKDGGKCTLSIAGQEQDSTWEETKDGFKIEGQLEATVDGKTATIEYAGMTMTLEKE